MRVQAEYTGSAGVIDAQWSPTMDVCALASRSHVEARRPDQSWLKLWSLQLSDEEVTTLAWRPDGQVLALACTRTLRLLRSEDGVALSQQQLHEAAISLAWAGNVHTSGKRLPSQPDRAASASPSVLSSPAGKQHSSKQASSTPSKLMHPCMHSGWCVLFILTQSLHMILLPFGSLCVSTLPLASHILGSSDRLDDVHTSHIRADQAHQMITLSIMLTSGTARILSIHLPLLSGPESDFACTCMQFAGCDDLLCSTECAADNATSSWHTLRAELHERFVQPMKRLLEEQAANCTVQESLMLSLSSGISSEEEQQFLLGTFGEAEAIKLLSRIDSLAGDTFCALAWRVVPCLDACLHRLGELRGVARVNNDDVRNGIPLVNGHCIEDAVFSSTQARTAAFQCAQKATELRSRFRAFLLWLIRLIKRLGLREGQETLTDVPTMDHAATINALDCIQYNLDSDNLSQHLGCNVADEMEHKNASMQHHQHLCQQQSQSLDEQDSLQTQRCSKCSADPKAIHDAAMQYSLSSAVADCREMHKHSMDVFSDTIQERCHFSIASLLSADWIHLSQCVFNERDARTCLNPSIVAAAKLSRSGLIVLLRNMDFGIASSIQVPDAHSIKAASINQQTQLLLLLEAQHGPELSLVDMHTLPLCREYEAVNLELWEQQRLKLPLTRANWLITSAERDVAIVMTSGKRIVLIDLSEQDENGIDENANDTGGPDNLVAQQNP